MKFKISIILLLTIFATLLSIRFGQAQEVTSIWRSDEEQELTLYADKEGEKLEIPITVTPREMTEKEIHQAFDTLESDLEKIFIGENQDTGHIVENLSFPSQIWNGNGKVRWEVEPNEYLSLSGVVSQDIPEEGVIGQVTAYVTCGEREQIVCYPIKMIPKEKTKEEQYLSKLLASLKETEQESRTKEEIELPSSFLGEQLHWKMEKGNTFWAFPILGLVAMIACLFKEKQENQQKELIRQESFASAYPAVVSESAILLDAGMTMSAMWKALSQSDQGPIYQEMTITYYQIQTGTPEVKAYEEFARRTSNIQYQKWIALLLQNMQKGTRQLHELLNQEVLLAMESRKNQVIRASEKAGTKLLLPLMILLVVVVAILMLPALWSFQL